MAKKIYSFTYGFHQASVKFEVDLDKFTPVMANETLTFFNWYYDDEADPIDEVMKKYALEVLRFLLTPHFHSVESVTEGFNEEGFATIDGSCGILLLEYEEFSLDQDELEMEVKDA